MRKSRPSTRRSKKCWYEKRYGRACTLRSHRHGPQPPPDCDSRSTFEVLVDQMYDAWIEAERRPRRTPLPMPSLRDAFRSGVAAALLVESKIREAFGVVPSR